MKYIKRIRSRLILFLSFTVTVAIMLSISIYGSRVYATGIVTSSVSSGTSITSCGELQYGIQHGTSNNGDIQYVSVPSPPSNNKGYIGITIPGLGTLSLCTQNPLNNTNFQNIPTGDIIYYTEPGGANACVGSVGCHQYQVYNPVQPASSQIPSAPPTSTGSGSINDPLGGSIGTSSIVSTLLSIVLPIIYGLIGLIVLGLISYAGFLLMTSAGDSNKVEKAKSVLTGAIIGVSIILLAYIISLVLVHTL